MSTITVVRKGGHAAVAADSLTKWGPAKESARYVRNHDKILRVGDSYLAVTGPTSAKLILQDYFAGPHGEQGQAAAPVPPRLDSVEAIFAVWRALHGALKEHYFLNPDEDAGDSFESSRMDVLIANPCGVFGVAAHRAVQEFSRFYAYGRGGEYAMGAMYAAYEDPALSAEAVARLGVEAAAEFDDGTGPPVLSFAVALRAD